MPFVDRGDNFLDGQASVAGANFLAELVQVFQGLPVPPPSFHFIWHDAGNGFAVAQDDDRPAALDLVE